MRPSQKKMKQLKAEGEALNKKQEAGLIPNDRVTPIIQDFNRRQWGAFVESEKDRKVAEKEKSDRHLEEVVKDTVNATFNHPKFFVMPGLGPPKKSVCANCGSKDWTRKTISYYPTRKEVCDRCHN